MSKPSVAVIGGTGSEGSGLAVRWSAAGYPIVIGSRSAEKAAEVSAELRALLPAGSAALTGATNADAAEACEIVMLSVPYSAQENTIAQIAEQCQGKVLITVVAPLQPPKVSTVWHPPGGSAAQEAQAQLGSSVRVVAAFQNIAAGHLKDLTWTVECDVLLAGDDRASKQIAMELARAAGFFAVDAGPLANASVLEGLTAVLIGINARHKVTGSGIRITGIPADDSGDHLRMGHAIYRVTAFESVGDYALRIRFDDGTEQVIDFEPVLYGPVFGPLREQALFNRVQLVPEAGCLEWPTGADFDPETLHNWPEYKDEIVAERRRRYAVLS